MDQNDEFRRTWSIRKPLGIGIFSIVIIFGVLGIWGWKANISGAIIAKGKIQVATNQTAVQHLKGGVIAEVLAENGNLVNAGDLVLRLDDTQLRSELKIVEGELFEALANIARLESEIDDQKELNLHPLLREASLEFPEIQSLIGRQQRQLDSHYQSLDTNSRLLGEQIKQIEKQIAGVEAELSAKTERMTLLELELESSNKLFEKGLIPKSTVLLLQKDQLTTRGDVGKLAAKIAELNGKISELGLKLHTLTPIQKEKAVEKLSKLRPARTKFLEQRTRVLDELTKLEIRSPISGKVHDSRVLGIRSVVVSAIPLMYIIPNDTPISVSVRVRAIDIDQIYARQQASLKFDSFSRRSTPVIFGEVSNISADAFLDAKTGKLFYNVEISLSDSEIEKLGKNSLISGMPVNAFFTTKSRSPLEYVTKPIMVYFDKAFRDS